MLTLSDWNVVFAAVDLVGVLLLASPSARCRAESAVSTVRVPRVSAVWAELA